jgi:uncharacterized membrane protein
MTSPILYCGDTSLDGAAAYLAGLMSAWGWAFDYVPSDLRLAVEDVADRRLVILSDYPATKLSADAQQRLVEEVAGGCGLLMIGGWESFHGVGGDWDLSALATVLPVEIQSTDDRLNCDHPVLVRHVAGDSPVSRLPWADRPPVIGGFNRFEPRDGASVVLEADRLSMSYADGRWHCALIETHPLLVLGRHEAGRTAAIATDVAPHWVGGFVDWGEGRVTGQASGGEAIEVGDLYAEFWRLLLTHLQRE